MATKNLNTRIVLRNDTKAHWQSVNPILMKGELGVEFDPSATSEGRKILFKIGDGVTAWNNLPYYSDPQASNIVDFSSHSWGTISVGGDEPTLGFTISADEYQEALRSSGVIMPKGSPSDQYNQIAVASGEMTDAGARLFDYLEIGHTYADWPERVSITLSQFAVLQNPENPSQYIYGLVTQEKTDLSDVFAALDGFNAGYTVASAINDVNAVASAAQATADSAASAAASAASAASTAQATATSAANAAAAAQGRADSAYTLASQANAAAATAQATADSAASAAASAASAATAAQNTANTAFSTAAAAMDILNNATSGLVSRVEVIEQDHLTSADKQELNDAIATVSASAAANTQAIGVLNGTVGVAGSVIKTVTDTINATGGIADRISNIEVILPAASFSASQTVAGAINALDSRIDALEGNHFEIAPASADPDRHPDVANPQFNVIYLVPKPDGFVGYAEWIRIEQGSPATQSWEKIGDTDVDLSNYYTKTESDARFAPISHNHDGSYAPITHNHDDRYYTKNYVDQNILDETQNQSLAYRINALENAGYATATWVSNNFVGKSAYTQDQATIASHFDTIDQQLDPSRDQSLPSRITALENDLDADETGSLAARFAVVEGAYASKNYVDNNFVKNNDVLILDCGNASTNYSAS